MNRPTPTVAEVVEIEIAGLKALANALRGADGELAAAFDAAVEMCAKIEGRLVVTGMGKSGHIARKIAATFASTGTPAAFVHPGDASHGDLGMISQQDAILALSKSGETPELGDIIGYAGRFGIPIIAITSNSESTLARASDAKLIMPEAREACAVTQAPTTSTTMMIALGDALAVTVLRRKGITADDFHNFHPGGRLGASLKRVADLMHKTGLPLCRSDDPIAKAVGIISEKGFGCVGVEDDRGALVGMITDGDLRRHFGRAPDGARVGDIMTKNPLVLEEDSLAAEALHLLSERKITSIFVLDAARRPIGLLHVHDCLSVGVI